MIYPERYPNGYMAAAIEIFENGDDDMAAEVFEEGYRHMARLLRGLFLGIRTYDTALLFCVMNRYMDATREMFPPVDELAEMISKCVNHKVSIGKAGENDDHESKN